MKKHTFYIKALLAKAHYRRNWVVRVFSLVQADQKERQSLPFDLKQLPNGFYVVNPETLEDTLIEDAVVGEPLLTAFENIEVPPNTFQHWPEGGLTTVGNLLFNACAIWPAFGSQFGYFNSEVKIGDFEKVLADRMVDDVAPGVTKDTSKVYIEDYLKFCEGVGYLQEFTQLFCWGLTEKAVTPPDNVEAKKAEVLEKYKDNLNDPLTQTKIYKELVAYDADYLKGDPSERFLISEKSRATVRRKLFLIQGAEPGLTNSQELPLIKNSLTQGWEKDSFPQLVDTLRSGSFDRGSETELGGVEAKWLMRSTGNVRVLDNDCGTQLGKRIVATDQTFTRLIKRYITQDGKPVLVENAEQAKALIGKEVSVRSPHYCNHTLTDYCVYCLGATLSANKEAVSLAATSYGSGFLSIFLAKMHATVMKSATMDLKACIT